MYSLSDRRAVYKKIVTLKLDCKIINSSAIGLQPDGAFTSIVEPELASWSRFQRSLFWCVLVEPVEQVELVSVNRTESECDSGEHSRMNSFSFEQISGLLINNVNNSANVPTTSRCHISPTPLALSTRKQTPGRHCLLDVKHLSSRRCLAVKNPFEFGDQMQSFEVYSVNINLSI